MPIAPCHQPLDRTARDVDVFAAELLPDLPRSVHLPIRVPDPLDGDPQVVIALGARRPLRRIHLPGVVQKIRRWGDRQHRADRLNPIRGPVVIHKLDHYFTRRSSAAWAKYADAFRKISFGDRLNFVCRVSVGGGRPHSASLGADSRRVEQQSLSGFSQLFCSPLARIALRPGALLMLLHAVETPTQRSHPNVARDSTVIAAHC